MEIRKLNNADNIDEISDIYARSWKSAYSGIVPKEYLDGIKSDQWVEKLSGNQFDSFVILDENKYIGTSAICEARDEQMKGWGEIVSIYLLPEYVGKGYGKSLFTFVINHLLETGYKQIYLWVLEQNINARLFYEKHGFHKNGDSLQIEISGEKLTDIRYVKSYL